jgi:FkbM family methyltransferase
MTNITIIDAFEPKKSPLVRASLWPGKEGAISLKVTPCDDGLVRLGISGEWPEHPDAILTISLRDPTEHTEFDPVGIVGLIQGRITQPTQFKYIIGSITNYTKASRQALRPDATTGAFAAAVPASASDLFIEEKTFSPQFEIRLVRGEKVEDFEIIVSCARMISHYDPRVFIENYVDNPDAQTDVTLTRRNAAHIHYNKWFDKEGSKLQLTSEQQLINPFVVYTTGPNMNFPMFCSTNNSLRWYGRAQFHNLDMFVRDGLVTDGGVVLDCGAHAGLYTTFFGKLVGRQGRVFAFDPFPQNNIQIEANAILNGLENVHVEWAGVGSKETTLSVSNREQKLSVTSHKDMIQIRTVPLDNYIKYRPTLLKLDVEGFEVEALKGAQKLLHECTPKCYIEVHTHFLPLFGADSRDVFRLVPLDLYDAYIYGADIEEGMSNKLDPNFIMKHMGRVILMPKRIASGGEGTYVP